MKKVSFFCVLTGLMGVLICCAPEHKEGAPERAVVIAPKAQVLQSSFNLVYSKVFQPRCIGCHGGSGGVNLETYEGAKAVIKKIRHEALVELSMPAAPYPPLTRRQLNVLAAWVQAEGPEFPMDGSKAPELAPLTPTYRSIQDQILNVRCVICHRPLDDAAKIPMSRLTDLLDPDQGLVVPGDPAKSKIYLALFDNVQMPLRPMPPRDSTMAPLSAEQREIIRQWIANGAKD